MIFAMPDTLTGSIGVVGGKLAPGGALDQLGVKTYPMGRGKRANHVQQPRAVEQRRGARRCKR
jgi:ClpP class serine protease